MNNKKKSSIIKHFIAKKELESERPRRVVKNDKSAKIILKNKVHGDPKVHDKGPSRSPGKTSTSKKIWEKILSNPTSKNLLKNSWSSDNPQKTYEKTIKKLAKNLEIKE
jgi:hypothetical protein